MVYWLLKKQSSIISLTCESEFLGLHLIFLEQGLELPYFFNVKNQEAYEIDVGEAKISLAGALRFIIILRE